MAGIASALVSAVLGWRGYRIAAVIFAILAALGMAVVLVRGLADHISPF
jgi:hypothetical protein